MDACYLWFDLRSALCIHVVLVAESDPFCNVRVSDVDPPCREHIQRLHGLTDVVVRC